jgi:MFS family permease
LKNIKTSGFHHAFLIVVASCAMASCGAIVWNCAGIFMVPVTNDLGISSGMFSIFLSIQSVAQSLLFPIIGSIMARTNARILLSICVMITAIALGAMSTFTSVIQFYIAAVFLGTTGPLVMVCVPTLIYRWFSVQNGFYIGLCSAFTGIGAIILNPLGGYIIANYGWRIAYLFFAAFIAFIIFPLVALFIRDYPSEKGLKPYGYTEETTSDHINPDVDTGVSFSAAIKSSPFFILIIFAIACGFSNAFIVHLPAYADSIGKDISIGAAIASFSMVGLLLGKIALGYLSDKTVIGALIVCGLCGFTGVSLMMFLGPGKSNMLLLGAFIFGICLSAPAVQTPLLVNKIFGIRQFTQIYSVIIMIFGLAQAVAQTLWGFIADAMGGSYFIPLSIALGIALTITAAGSAAYKARNKLAVFQGYDHLTDRL